MKIILIVLVLALAAVGVLLFIRSRRIPDRVEALGPFELITHTHRYLTGYNEGRIGRGTTESYSLRYRGQPFRFTGKAGMFGQDTVEYSRMNMIITFPSPEPAFIVNVGDPNNTSFYYLVRERDGQAVTELAAEGHGEVSGSWLDPDPGSEPAVADIAVHRGRMEGGRLLLLGGTGVVDTRTLTIYPVPAIPGASVNQFKPPLALSPARISFVRWASGESPENAPMLAVFNFRAGTGYTLPIDRRVMRFNSWEEVDQAWFDHYFRWVGDSPESERLEARPDATPLPYHGTLRDDGTGYREYQLLSVDPAMLDTVVAFILREFDAVRVSAPPGYGADLPTLQIGEQQVHVSRHQDEVGVWMDRGQNSRLVAEIGSRFDRELATGKLDHLFQ